MFVRTYGMSTEDLMALSNRAHPKLFAAGRSIGVEFRACS